MIEKTIYMYKITTQNVIICLSVELLSECVKYG